MGGMTSGTTSSVAGDLKYCAANAVPYGWLKANGAAVSRASYAALFAAIGTTYGGGDGATTFNLPDYRGEFIRGFDDGRGVDSGRVFGSAQADELKSHAHTEVGSLYGTGGILGSGGSWNIVGADTSATGGAETRPRNLAALVCIKY